MFSTKFFFIITTKLTGLRSYLEKKLKFYLTYSFFFIFFKKNKTVC